MSSSLDPLARISWLCFLLRNRLARDELGVIAQHGIGDHFLVCSLADAIAKSYEVKVVVAGRPELSFLSRDFTGVSRYLKLPKPCRGHQVGRRQVSKGRWIYGHFWGMELARAIGYKDFELLDAYRCRFGLAPNAALEPPQPPDESMRKAATEYLTRLGFRPGRTIVVSPGARSTPHPGLDGNFFEQTANKLQCRGWNILYNGEGPKGHVSQIIPLHMFRAITQMAGGFLGVRSGLCDLVVDLRMKAVVLYSDTKYLGGPLYDGTKLQNYGFPNTPVELVLRGTNTELLQREIETHFT